MPGEASGPSSRCPGGNLEGASGPVTPALSSTITIDADDTSLSLSPIWSDMSTLSTLLSQNLEDIEKIGLEKAKRIRTLTSIRPRHYWSSRSVYGSVSTMTK